MLKIFSFRRRDRIDFLAACMYMFDSQMFSGPKSGRRLVVFLFYSISNQIMDLAPISAQNSSFVHPPEISGGNQESCFFMS